MKKLLILIIIWLGLTIYLAHDNLKLKEFKEENVHWRAFLVYSHTLIGCMQGSEYTNYNYDFVPTYTYCRNLAFDEKERYLLKWKIKSKL